MADQAENTVGSSTDPIDLYLAAESVGVNPVDGRAYCREVHIETPDVTLTFSAESDTVLMEVEENGQE